MISPLMPFALIASRAALIQAANVSASLRHGMTTESSHGVEAFRVFPALGEISECVAPGITVLAVLQDWDAGGDALIAPS